MGPALGRALAEAHAVLSLRPGNSHDLGNLGTKVTADSGVRQVFSGPRGFPCVSLLVPRMHRQPAQRQRQPVLQHTHARQGQRSCSAPHYRQKQHVRDHKEGTSTLSSTNVGPGSAELVLIVQSSCISCCSWFLLRGLFGVQNQVVWLDQRQACVHI